ncbi:MAG: tyrosine/phenylalanine carboxypeptidase domain-containing protein [Gillisia sp.]
MQVSSQLSSEFINQILTKLENEAQVETNLPGGGFLHLEKKLPFLLVYRKKADGEDLGTQRLVKSGASFLIIGTEEFEAYQELLYNLAEKQSASLNSYLLFEIYRGPQESKEFVIKGPSQKLSSTFEILQEELNKINNTQFGVHLTTTIKKTKSRQAKGEAPLLEIEKAKTCGALWLGLEVPPVYINTEGTLYPVFLRQFRNHFSKAIQKALYNYLRVQTSSGIKSYNALGKRKIDRKVFEIDKELTKIESSFQFLLLVAPVNIQQMRKEFFESRFQHLMGYHYRLLPIDPDLLKRKLYNLKIDEIDDPAISFLFEEKRRELDIQISMLNERGTRDFFFNSIRLYREVDNSLLKIAENILNEVPEVHEPKEEKLLDAKEFSAMARREFEYFRSQDENFSSKVHLRKDVNIIMVSRGELYIPSDYKLTRTEADALIQHEIGTHVLTCYNGSQQPLTQMAVGLADYDPLQEGIAVLSEYLGGKLTANRLRILAGRVVAGAALIRGLDFKQIFSLLFNDFDFSKERAFNVTSRILQGGGFIKDIIYLKGLVELIDYLKEGNELEPLLAGKFALGHLHVINELTQRGILKEPVLKPRYLETEEYKERMNLIRKGLPLSQMVKK